MKSGGSYDERLKKMNESYHLIQRKKPQFQLALQGLKTLETTPKFKRPSNLNFTLN